MMKFSLPVWNNINIDSLTSSLASN